MVKYVGILKHDKISVDRGNKPAWSFHGANYM